MKSPSKIYSPPAFVSAFRISGLLCLLLAVAGFITGIVGETSLWLGVGLVLAALGNFLYADMADALARTHWRVDLLAHQLQIVISEAELTVARRSAAEREAQASQEAEIQRVLDQQRAGLERPTSAHDNG